MKLRISVPVRSTKSELLREGKKVGLKGIALEKFSSTSAHIIEYSVDPTSGDSTPLRIDSSIVLQVTE